eukprot:m.56459 g.56459  ORF g.56459 m.56459 type:complete len:224 (+) comp7681_c0_seq1:460-1131(+)
MGGASSRARNPKLKWSALDDSINTHLESATAPACQYSVTTGKDFGGRGHIYEHITFQSVNEDGSPTGQVAYTFTWNKDARQFDITDGQGAHVGTHLSSNKGTHSTKGQWLSPWFIPKAGWTGVLSTAAAAKAAGPRTKWKGGKNAVWKGGEGNTFIYRTTRRAKGRTTSYFYDEDGVTLMKRVFHKGRLEPVIVFPWAADITHLLLGLMLDSLDADNMRLGRN